MPAHPSLISTEIHQRSLVDFLDFEPTGSQSQAIYALARLLSSQRPRCALLIKGYAGTGKTTLMRSLVKHLTSMGSEAVLLAPTGRAAKVLSQYTGRFSSTIHRHIYRRNVDASGRSHFSLAPNKRENVLFIVDEASMLGNDKGVVYNGLLDDLMAYVFSGPGCKLVLLGDDAQLPPVGLDQSPAMDVDTMRSDYDLTIAGCTMIDIVRQDAQSAILSLATAVRMRVFDTEDKNLTLNYSKGPEVFHLDPRDLADELESCYSHYGVEQVRVICRSNRSANQYNQQIRQQVLQLDDRIGGGDLVMIVRNNYLWTQEEGNMPFIANGDLAEVLYVKEQRQLYEMEFARLGLDFMDYPDEPTMEAMALLDTLEEKSSSMSEDKMSKLYAAVKSDHAFEGGPSSLQEKMQKDPWYNALQIKFGYAVTCHKAQGGQWPVVFVDRGYLTDEMMDREFWKWLYTAVTRATEKLYLIGF
ncbi:MAG: AAA family ATPase [Flavobacteriales bacterium]|nr:AAA family ATPase [Flavobacteriales bacterium]